MSLILRYILAQLESSYPEPSVSRAVQYLKGRSSHKLLSEFGLLRKRYWGKHLWARGYWVASSGNVTDDMWVDHIKNQTRPSPMTTSMSRELLPCPRNGGPIRL
jgi:putative transposase